MAFFPRAFASEFAPIFHLLDNYAAHSAQTSAVAGARQLRTFQPKFDIKENRDNYELHGELPGVQRDHLSIEFTDSQTLAIKGRTESYREEGTRPAATIEAAPTQAALENTPSSSNPAQSPNKKTNQAYVEEDEEPFVQIDSASTTTTSETPTTTPNAVQQQQRSNPASPSAAAATEDKSPSSSRYWLSERSIGTFARSFQFPTRVDQDHVKASLTNGILSIVIPKSTAPESRRIPIE